MEDDPATGTGELAPSASIRPQESNTVRSTGEPTREVALATEQNCGPQSEVRPSSLRRVPAMNTVPGRDQFRLWSSVTSVPTGEGVDGAGRSSPLTADETGPRGAMFMKELFATSAPDQYGQVPPQPPPPPHRPPVAKTGACVAPTSRAPSRTWIIGTPRRDPSPGGGIVNVGAKDAGCENANVPTVRCESGREAHPQRLVTSADPNDCTTGHVMKSNPFTDVSDDNGSRVPEIPTSFTSPQPELHRRRPAPTPLQAVESVTAAVDPDRPPWVTQPPPPRTHLPTAALPSITPTPGRGRGDGGTSRFLADDCNRTFSDADTLRGHSSDGGHRPSMALPLSSGTTVDLMNLTGTSASECFQPVRSMHTSATITPKHCGGPMSSSNHSVEEAQSPSYLPVSSYNDVGPRGKNRAGTTRVHPDSSLARPTDDGWQQQPCQPEPLPPVNVVGDGELKFQHASALPREGRAEGSAQATSRGGKPSDGGGSASSTSSSSSGGITMQPSQEMIMKFLTSGLEGQLPTEAILCAQLTEASRNRERFKVMRTINFALHILQLMVNVALLLLSVFGGGQEKWVDLFLGGSIGYTAAACTAHAVSLVIPLYFFLIFYLLRLALYRGWFMCQSRSLDYGEADRHSGTGDEEMACPTSAQALPSEWAGNPLNDKESTTTAAKAHPMNFVQPSDAGSELGSNHRNPAVRIGGSGLGWKTSPEGMGDMVDTWKWLSGRDAFDKNVPTIEAVLPPPPPPPMNPLMVRQTSTPASRLTTNSNSVHNRSSAALLDPAGGSRGSSPCLHRSHLSANNLLRQANTSEGPWVDRPLMPTGPLCADSLAGPFLTDCNPAEDKERSNDGDPQYSTFLTKYPTSGDYEEGHADEDDCCCNASTLCLPFQPNECMYCINPSTFTCCNHSRESLYPWHVLFSWMRGLYFLLCVAVLALILVLSFQLLVGLALAVPTEARWQDLMLDNETSCFQVQGFARCSGWKTLCNEFNYASQEEAWANECPYCPIVQPIIATSVVTCVDSFAYTKQEVLVFYEVAFALDTLLIIINFTVMSVTVCLSAWD